MGYWGQDGFGVRLEWGREGVETLGATCAVLVIVDVLSFSTTVDLVLSRGGRARPLTWRADARLPRPAAIGDSPGLTDLPSPNGATLTTKAKETGATVLVGCLRNADAVAEAANELAGTGAIGIIAAGERWGVSQGPLRPCVEDHLGAGAIVTALSRTKSPEAALASAAYQATDVERALTECSSGRELIGKGHGADIPLAAALNVSTTVPILKTDLLEQL
ncbi:2-phosphosulfolactate phosphatase [Amycolatopsis xylanica]|uniref:2-phosphosulfolactate phosphatase n=1 Tax=Amycolatopsis xylanica TaxID=589385 RepID=UPI000B86E7C3|nr:2-phosphosulfolactate phosphatase [Amycolatopsis xylanica]